MPLLYPILLAQSFIPYSISSYLSLLISVDKPISNEDFLKHKYNRVLAIYTYANVVVCNSIITKIEYWYLALLPIDFNDLK